MENMRDILLAEYGLHLLESYALTGGTADCFQVFCTEGDFFLKVYPSEFTLSDIEKEAKLVSFLLSRGFPVARFCPTKRGENGITVGGQAVGVQKFIPGHTYLNDLPRPLLWESAKYLGMLHRCLKDYPMKQELDGEWVNRFSAQKALEKCDKLLAVLEENRSDPNYERIRQDLIFKKMLFPCIENLKSYYTGITNTPSQGDYSARQLICDKERIKAVIDFLSAASLPAIWEIMRSYMQSSGTYCDGRPLNIANLLLYVREYLKYFPLSPRDLTAMPYVYLFQLARSLYGYKEYLLTKTKNRNALIAFAFWRTDVCRGLYGQVAEIAYALGGLR